jgi:formylmethanofuran dehydrogenase subunit E
MEPELDPPDEIECADCGDLVRRVDAKQMADQWVCRACFELYDPEL